MSRVDDRKSIVGMYICGTNRLMFPPRKAIKKAVLYASAHKRRYDIFMTFQYIKNVEDPLRFFFSLRKIICFPYFRYTMVMIYYAICLVNMMLIRPLLSTFPVAGRGTKSIYAALYFLPILVLIQAVLAGILCKFVFKRNELKYQAWLRKLGKSVVLLHWNVSPIPGAYLLK